MLYYTYTLYAIFSSMIGGIIMQVSQATRYKCYISSSTLIASLLGIYAQRMTYFIVDTLLGRDVRPLLVCLTALTVLSVLLFLLPHILVRIGVNKHNFNKRPFTKYLVANGVIGSFISFFSIIVAIAWWG